MSVRVAILSCLFLLSTTAKAAAVFSAITDVTVTISGIINLTTFDDSLSGLNITGSSATDLETASFSGSGSSAYVFPITAVLGDPLALTFGDSIYLYAEAAGTVPGTGSAEAFALTSGWFDIVNASTTNRFQVFFDLSWYISADATVTSPLIENALAKARFDVFSNTIELNEEVIADTVATTGPWGRSDLYSFSIVLEPGTSDTLTIYADAVGLAVGTTLPPVSEVPEPFAFLLVGTGLAFSAFLRKVLLPNMKSSVSLLSLVAFLALYASTSVSAADLADVSFVKIAQTGDDPPGITGPLTGFDIQFFNSASLDAAPAVDELKRVAFVGRDFPLVPSAFNSGIFLGSGGPLTTIADRSVNSPGPTGDLTWFSTPAISTFGVVFRGADSIGRSVILEPPAGRIITFRPVAQYLDTVPGAPPNTFNGVGSPKLSGSYAAFSGNFPAGVANRSGLFISRIIPDSSASIPESFAVAMSGDDPPGPVGPFTALHLNGSSFRNRGIRVAFAASDANLNDGIFIGSFNLRPRRVFTEVISEGDPLPDNGGFFTFASAVDFDGRNVLFTGVGTPTFTSAVYVKDTVTGTLVSIVKPGDNLPGAVPQLDNNSPAGALSDSGFVVISARNSARAQSLLIRIDGRIRKIIDTNDSLNGKRIALIAFAPQGLKGNSLAFGVEFTDGTQAIYRADLTIQ